LKVWDLRGGRERFTLGGFYYSVWDVAFSPDGRRLAAAIGLYQNRAPGEVRVWDMVTGNEIYSLRGHPDSVWSVSFSPDGTRLASAGGIWVGAGTPKAGEVMIWDMSSGQQLCTLQGHTGAITSAAFSPCGRRLATASKDGTVMIWDGTPLAQTPQWQAAPKDP
jgi:WD40 repeat protein